MNIFEDDEIDEVNFIVHGIPRQILQRNHYFDTFDDDKFFKRFRITKPTALNIVEMIENQIEFPYNLNNAVSPINQLLVFLRFCATGSHISCIADFSGVHPSTASRIIVRVANAIASLYNRFIKMPATEDERNRTCLCFYEKAHFPKVIGAIDCTHIKIQSPGGEDGEIFRNRKGYFSVNVQCICDADLKFMNVVVRWPGSTHDATIFNNSRIRMQFENNIYPNCVLLGDSGYPVKPYLLTPLLNPITRAEQLYNESQIRTRNTIERTFGVWKRRFPVLAYGCRLKLQTTLTVVVACAVLHNICRQYNELEPPDPEDVERFIQVLQEDAVPDVPEPNANNGFGFQFRNNLIENYFQFLDE